MLDGWENSVMLLIHRAGPEQPSEAPHFQVAWVVVALRAAACLMKAFLPLNRLRDLLKKICHQGQPCLKPS